MVTNQKNTSYDKTQKLKLWQNSKSQIGTKLKNSNCHQTKKKNCKKTKKTTKFDKIQKLVPKFKNSKTHIVTKLKKLKL